MLKFPQRILKRPDLLNKGVFPTNTVTVILKGEYFGHVIVVLWPSYGWGSVVLTLRIIHRFGT